MKLKKSIAISFLMLAPIFSQAQCAMCRAVLESSGDQGQAEALNDGIVYLMVFPYILIGGLGFFIWWGFRKKNKKAEVSQ